jgi:hypothetical protein
MQGRIGEIIPLIEQAHRDTPGLVVLGATLMWARARVGMHTEARSMLDAEMDSDFPMWNDSTWLVAHALWADVAARTTHRPAANLLFERLRPWHRQVAFTHASLVGCVAHYLGRLAHTLERLDEADEWFAEALAFHANLEAPYFVALTKSAWAELLVDRNRAGDTDRARVLLDESVAVAAARDYGYVEQDSRALLERLGR